MPVLDKNIIGLAPSDCDSSFFADKKLRTKKLCLALFHSPFNCMCTEWY